MIKVWKALKEEGLKSRLILQVHDELLVETAQEEEARVREILTENMKSAADLAVTSKSICTRAITGMRRNKCVL